MRTKPASLLRWEDAAHAITEWTGKPWTFAVAVLIIVVWAASGPLFGFSNTWQLLINTGTTIITFLMVFIIQSSQNRDTESLLIKIDELILTKKGAKNELLDIEEKSDEEIEKIHEKYEKLAKQKNKTKKKPSSKKK